MIDTMEEQQHHEAQLHQLHQLQHHPADDGLLEPRGGFDHDDGDIQHVRMLDEVDGLDEEDEDAGVRSISTNIPHELELVDEEDEEELAGVECEENEEHERHGPMDELEFGEDDTGVMVGGDEVEEDDDSRADPIDPEREREDELDRQRDRDRAREHRFEKEAALRKREDLDVGRPRTPEPSFGLGEDYTSTDATKPNGSVATTATPLTVTTNNATTSPRARSGTLMGPSPSRSPPLPLARPSGTESTKGSGEEVMGHVLHLGARVLAMEVQYSAAQDVNKALQSKVLDLEKMIKSSKEDKPGADAVATVSLSPAANSSPTSSMILQKLTATQTRKKKQTINP